MPTALVIGAGIVGAACAAVLARAGYAVTVLEPGPVGGGASAAGMGHLVVMDDSPAQLALTSRSLALWRDLAGQLPARAEYRPCGTLWVAADGEELAATPAKQALYALAGVASEVIEAAELARLEPALRAGLAGGLRVPDDAVVYAPVVAAYLLERAGATLRREAVTALVPGGVRLAGGDTLSADLTVLAGGVGAARLLPGLPLRPRQGHLLITERAPEAVRHQLVELGYLKSAHGGDVDSVAFNVQPRPGGQLLVGSSRQFGRERPDLDWAMLRRMLARAADYLPGLRSASALRAWTGLRAATPDHLPIVGPHPEHPNLYLAVGHEGLGVTTALGTAELLGAYVSGQATPLKADDYALTPGRFAEAVHA